MAMQHFHLQTDPHTEENPQGFGKEVKEKRSNKRWAL